MPASVVPLKLAVVRDAWGVTIEYPDPAHLRIESTYEYAYAPPKVRQEHTGGAGTSCAGPTRSP